MSIAADLVTYLGTALGCGIHRLRIPPDPTFPLVVYQIIDTPELHVSGYVHPRVQFSCWAATDIAADTLASALRTALEGFHGLMGTTHVHAMVVNRLDDFEELSGLYRVILDARLLYREP